jgi:hypothetical protein
MARVGLSWLRSFWLKTSLFSSFCVSEMYRGRFYRRHLGLTTAYNVGVVWSQGVVSGIFFGVFLTMLPRSFPFCREC